MSDGETIRAAVHRAVMGRNAKQLGNGEVAFTCPNPDRHERGDMHPSAHWNLGKGTWICRVCGASGGFKNLADALGITVEPEPTQVREITYDYQDADGKRLFQVVRREFSDGSKTFSQRREDHTGKWVWDLKGVRRVLYGLPEIVNADEDEPVLVNEGEKAVAAARSLGYVATTNPGGAGKGKWRPTFNETLAGRHVVILPDNDGPGQGHAQQVAEALLPHAASVRVVNLPGLPARGDVHDWVGAGHGRDDLAALIAATDTYIVPPITGRENGPAPTGSRPEPFTDIYNAARLIEFHGADLRYCQPWRSWVVWDGKRWSENALGATMLRAQNALLRLRHEAADLGGDEGEKLWKHAVVSSGDRRVAGMLNQAWPHVEVDPNGFDADPWLLNCRNGVLDLKTGTLSPHLREHLCTKITAAPYDPDARFEMWDQFVADICDGDPDVERFLARAVGCSLVGDQIEERVFFALGPTLTGKSTFLEAITAALGDYAMTLDFEALLQQRHGTGEGPRPMIAALRGRRFVKSIEVSEGRRLAEGLVKQLAGRDTIQVRGLNRDPFNLRPTYTLWLAANDRPAARHDDDALWRRMLELPFRHEFTTPDPKIKRQLTNPAIAGAAVLRWAMTGCLELQESGLQPPEAVLGATASYREDQDLSREFFEDHCKLADDLWVESRRIYGAYVTWAQEEQRIARPLTAKAFGDRVRRLGCDRDTRRIEGRKTRIWTGIGMEV